MSQSRSSIRQRAAVWLRQGISPRRLALTLALGFAIGCFPVIGIPTAICALLALGLRLNLPAIQAANYAVMPLQFLLIAPFVRLGGWLLAGRFQQAATAHAAPVNLLAQLGGMVGHAVLAWLVLAGPAVVGMTAALTVLLRRVPALAVAEAGD
jgi:uncharacterized protein (DUF2062 family)